ncbi:MAG: asparagine synthase (glutamine-hydrolyzing) [Coleofasciculaceae cyanobacterium]
MCGIAGIVGFDRTTINSQLLESLSDALSDRGPDDVGFLGWSGTAPVQVSRHPEAVAGNRLSLVHRRLSILDLTPSGWQPMGTPDGRYYITFNGEIYNYLELQIQLKALGHQFRSHSDTEVLLAAYAQWGVKAFTDLVGMFAFAILDTQERKLILARDYFGIKPLYYTYYQDGFAFASEIKALLNLPGVNRQVNPQRLYDYLRSGRTDYGSQTLFADIVQLPPAHYLEISLDNPQQTQLVKYWQLDLNQRLELSFSEATEQLRELFLDNIRLHLRSDVPVGAALSGGIDSSAIAMAMYYLQGKDLQLYTFSYIADDPALSEEKWVDLVGQEASAFVHKVQPQPDELVADLEHLIHLQDEPFGSTSIYAQYRVFHKAKEVGIKVMLDGQGADELLGGYRPYVAARLASLLSQGQWGKAKQFWQKASQLPDTGKLNLLVRAGGLLLPPNLQGSARRLVGKEHIPSWLNANWLSKHGAIPKLPGQRSSPEVLREELYQALVATSLPMLLRYEDRNSMAHSIESRVPFLTPSLVNFVFSLPEEFIINSDGTSKAIFRQAMRGIVPDAILNRRDKIGFATPEQSWLTTLRPWVEQVLHSEVAAQIPALNLNVVKTELQAVLDGQKLFDFRVWRWVNLIRWAERFSVSFDI